MTGCPGKKRATNANRVVNGRKYCMWLDKKPNNAIPVEIITWEDNGKPCTPPIKMKHMNRMGNNYTISVRIISSNSIATITNDPADLGAVFYGSLRATFHES
ncbi:MULTISPECIES: hypothetical protein [Acetobacter]|uniref:hypothetical protein n=1 Tax=Acetobacter TaxID=434 RepID=UPI0011124516|nr:MULTISPECIES: hypothetical protein [Acetobacter]KAA8423947.1 hypothetical protein FKW54_10735 [Acetobacter pomorum]KAA8438350.1 hypothetical protein FKW50_00540 [Acetobacter pomorum]KAA8452907.1 hypothetical protein FKW52_05765 [Acetobacter pomorum]